MGLGAIDRDRLNVAGSSLATGHPFAATGARILATAAKLLAERGVRPRADLDLRRRRPGRRGDRGAARRVSFSLALTPAQQDLVERTHAFARDVVRPAAEHHDRAQEFPWEILEQAAREGFYNPLFYRDLIGDPTGLSLPLFMEELFWGCAGIGLSIVMPALALSAIAQAATPAQLLRWAPECFGRAGSAEARRARDLRARGRLGRAQPAHDGAPRRRRLGHRRPQDLDRQRRHRRRPRRQRDRRPGAGPPRPGAVHRARATRPGCTLVRKLDKLGCRASHTAEIRFDGCRVPGDHLLGGDARLERRLAQRARGRERLRDARRVRADAPDGRGAGARDRRAALEFACDWAARREAFGGPILDKQGISFPLADLAADLDAARLLTWRASWMAAQGIPYHHAEGSMSKLKASEVAVRITEQAIQVAGGWGYISDHPVGEVVPRRQALHDLRGHERDPAARDRAHARRRRRGRAAAPPHAGRRRRRSAARWGAAASARSLAGASAMRAAQRTPPALLKPAMRILGPPQKPR